MFPLPYVVLTFILLYCNSFVLCEFDVEELKLIKYEVDILKTPVKANGEDSQPTLHIKSKYGQTYQCLLPNVEENEFTDEAENLSNENVDVVQLLKPIQSGLCFFKIKGWWTYEFCPGQHVKQYHIENGKILGQIITLGLYQSDYDWNSETDESKSRNAKKRYHSQFYSNGSKCELTDLPRSAEVRFYCEEGVIDYIYRIDEPGTCVYILTVHTPRICSHPKFKPLNSNKANVMSCSPVLDESQYAQYLKKIDELKKTEAENKQQLAVVQTAVNDLKKNENDPNKKLWKERDQEVDKLKSLIPPEKLAYVKDDLEKHPNSISTEAEESAINLDSKSKDEDFLEQASAVNLLTYNSDKIVKEADVAEALHELKKAQSEIMEKPEEEQIKKNSNHDESYNSKNSQDQKHNLPIVFNDDKLPVRVARLDKPPDNKKKVDEMDAAQRKELVQNIAKKLKKLSSEVDEQDDIPLQIITSEYYDYKGGNYLHGSSDEETDQFQNMVIAVLTGQHEATEERKRQDKLEENYKFLWNDVEQSDSDSDE